MTTLTRWKLASALLAAVAGYALFLRGPSADTPADEAVAAGRDGSLPKQFRRPLRISAELAGISKTELIERLKSAKSLKDVQLLSEKLGMVGDDASIRAVMPMLKDPRHGVPEAILGAIGHIGTEHAVDVLAENTHDDRMTVRFSAIAALGATQSKDAEKLLIELARTPGDPGQVYAISALGQIGSDHAAEVLVQLSAEPDFSIAGPSVYALGAIATPTARVALRKLIDAPDSRIASAAISAIDTVDGELLDKLGKIVKAGDPMLVSSALSALGKAGEAGLPALRDAALHGNPSSRWAAVSAIGQIGGASAIKTLGEILETGDRQSAMAAAAALSGIGGPEARELLIASALSDRGQITGAITQLAGMEGDDVDAALLKIIKDGSSAERRSALPRLLKAGNEEALKITIEMAAKGSRTERSEAMRLLADASSPKAWDALIDIAGKSRGQTRVSALEMLAQHRPGDPALEALLGDSLFSGRKEEAQYAANVLGRIGTEQARQTLITALTGNDKQLATAAAAALGQQAMTDSVKSALLAASRDNPQMKMQLMHQLVNLGAPEGMRLAEELLGDPKNAAAASSAIYALAQNGSADAKRIIEKALTSTEPSVKLAAITSLAQNPDDRSTDTLVRLTRDSDPAVRAAALSTLGQVGGDRAQQAILDASQSTKTEDKIAAISGLSTMDDPRASQQLARLMRDPDPSVAQMAIGSAYNGGPEVDQTLIAILKDPGAKDELKTAASNQLRGRGTDLDDATEQIVTKISGPPGAYGGYGYGGGGDLVDI